MEMEPLQLPALGRPFTLGTLYNAKTNQIIPGISLCDHEPADVKVCSNITYKTDMTSNDFLESKMKSLGITGNLTISALALPVELKGSGSYLSETKTSKRQARVVLESSGTTRHESLSSRCFSKEKVENHLEMINVFGATHIAVRITYGHQFFLQLETTCASEEEKQKLEGAIKLKLSSLVHGQAEGELTGTYTSKYKKELNELQVKIHGTVELDNNPISLKEALDIFKRIPELVKGKESPMTVYLLPLAAIHSSVSKVCRQIKEDILSAIISVFDDINSSQVALNGIQSSDMARKEPRIRRNAKQLSTMLHKYKIRLQMNLHDKLSDPKMEISEQILEVLRKHEDSPYSTNILGLYVSKMEKEVKFMEDLVRVLSSSHEDGSSGDGTNSKQGYHRETGRNKITVDIRSDENYYVSFDSSKVIELKLPIIREKNNLLEAMKSFDTNNDEGWTDSIAEPLTLPFEDEDMQKNIRRLVKSWADVTAGKGVAVPDTFICLLNVYKYGIGPSLTMYDGLQVTQCIQTHDSSRHGLILMS